MSDLPPADRKRRILHDDRTADDDLNALADGLVEAGRLGEALEVLEHTREDGRLRRLRETAIARGEVFVLAQTERLLKDQAPQDAWRATAEKALADARYRQARTAFERAGDEERAAAAAEKIPAPPPTRPGKERRGV